MALDTKIKPLCKAAEQRIDLASLERNHAAARATYKMVLVAGLGDNIAVFAFGPVNQAEPLL